MIFLSKNIIFPYLMTKALWSEIFCCQLIESGNLYFDVDKLDLTYYWPEFLFELQARSWGRELRRNPCHKLREIGSAPRSNQINQIVNN